MKLLLFVALSTALAASSIAFIPHVAYGQFPGNTTGNVTNGLLIQLIQQSKISQILAQDNANVLGHKLDAISAKLNMIESDLHNMSTANQTHAVK